MKLFSMSVDPLATSIVCKPSIVCISIVLVYSIYFHFNPMRFLGCPLHVPSSYVVTDIDLCIHETCQLNALGTRGPSAQLVDA